MGNRTQKTLPNGAYTTYNYSNRNWLTSLANRKSDATLVSSYAYAHDYVGNRTTMTEANGDVSSYVYDNVYRLVSEEKRDSGNTLLWRYQYTYDGVGNRLTMNNSGVVTYTYDANNKLTQLVGPGGTTTFGYDGNGNMTSMIVPGPITTTYGYDYENRLTSVTAPSYTASYTYAADGLRLRVQESNHAYPDRWMQYDGVRPVLEGTLSGDTFTTLNRYVLEGASYYDPLISASIGGSSRFYLYDGLGSTRQLLDANQAVTDTYQYEAFGNSMGSTGSTPNPYRYVGSLGYYQTGSSLMHLGARYYLPEIGRFVQRDPRFGASGYRYAYCTPPNPLASTDPTGYAIGGVIGGVLGAVVLVGGLGYCASSVLDSTQRTVDAEYPKSGDDLYLHCRVLCEVVVTCSPSWIDTGTLTARVSSWLHEHDRPVSEQRRHYPPDDAGIRAGQYIRNNPCKDCDSACQAQGYKP